MLTLPRWRRQEFYTHRRVVVQPHQLDSRDPGLHHVELANKATVQDAKSVV